MSHPFLIAACWTTAGACAPLAEDDRSPVPIRVRIEAAARAGFRGFGIRHGDLLAVEQSIGFREFRAMLDANGLDSVELEFLEGWYHSGRQRAASDRQRADLLRAAEALGARHIKVGGHLGGGQFESDRIAAELATLARQAGDAGTRVGLEPMPFADVRTPAMALEVVQKADHHAAGLFLDIWHISRANVDVKSLGTIAAEHIVGVELDDADAEVRGSLLEDTVNNRRFPGQGVLDVRGFVAAVRQTGYAGPWGVEMLSTDYRKMPVDVAAAQAYTTSVRCLAD